MNGLRRLGRRLLYGGSRHLRSYEQVVLEQAGAALGELDQGALKAQLATHEFVQRDLKGRMVRFCFDPQSPPRQLFSDSAEEHSLVQVQLETTASRIRATLMTHRGLLSSLEFSKDPAVLSGDAVRVTEVVLGGKASQLAPVADRAEHGK
jgi:hypothetical protein